MASFRQVSCSWASPHIGTQDGGTELGAGRDSGKPWQRPDDHPSNHCRPERQGLWRSRHPDQAQSRHRDLSSGLKATSRDRRSRGKD